MGLGADFAIFCPDFLVCAEEGYSFAVVGFVHECHLKAFYLCLIHLLEGESVEQKTYISHGVDMAIEVEVAIVESIFHRRDGGFHYATRQHINFRVHQDIRVSAEFGNRTGMIGDDICRDGEVREAIILASIHIKHHPYGRSIADRLAILIGYHKISDREVTIPRLYPGGKGIELIDRGVTKHLDSNSREHPPATEALHRRVTDAERIGVGGGDVNDLGSK